METSNDSSANWGEATEQIQEVYYEGEIFKVNNHET